MDRRSLGGRLAVAGRNLANFAGAVAGFALPDARLTPGAVGTERSAPAPLVQVCTRGYARAARHPYDAEWRRYRTAIFRAYGIPHVAWRNYTIDHLVPIELDGRPFGVDAFGRFDLANVWPEPKAEARQKDAVEDALHAAVCYRRGYSGLHLRLETARAAIARDWTRTPVGLPAPQSGSD